MSLIVTSNTQQEFAERRNDVLINPGAPIQDAYSFHNALSNTITIPANSEVAVISTSINRGTLINVGRGEIRWHLFFGQALTQNSVATYSMSEITSDTLPCVIPPGTYSPGEILPTLNTAINKAINHPKLWNRDGRTGASVGRVIHASTGFFPVPSPIGGYTFGMFQENRTATTNLATVGNAFVPITTGPTEDNGGPVDGVAGMTYAAGTITRTAVNDALPDYQWDSSAQIILSELPIATGGCNNWAVPLNATPLVPAVANVGCLSVDVRDAAPAPIDAGGDPQPGMGGWSVGLTRPQRQDRLVNGRRYKFQGPGYAEADGVTDFCDYEVRYVQDYDTGDGEVRLIHWIWNNLTDRMEAQDIEYWGNDLNAINGQYRTTAQGVLTGNADFGYIIQAGGGAGAGRLRELHWEVWNEEMRIWFSDANNANPVTVMDTTTFFEQTSTGAVAQRPGAGIQALGLTRCFKPTNELTRALYPRYNLSLNGAEFEIEEFHSDIPFAKRNGVVGADSWNYPSTAGDDPQEWTGGQTLWGQSLVAEPGQYGLQNIDDRANVSGPDISVYTYQRMAGDGTGAVGTLLQSLQYDFGIIINDDSDAADFDIGAYASAMMMDMPVTPQARTLLGYDVTNQLGNVFSNALPEIGRLYNYDYTAPVPVVVVSPFNDRSRFIVQSTNVPGITRNTCFVKCSSLTHQSYNFAKELPSKILWHIPKYDNQGNATGALFFENPSPVYLDLKNPAPLVINDLHIEIVDKNELHAKDLTGTTIVTLHIRDARR